MAGAGGACGAGADTDRDRRGAAGGGAVTGVPGPGGPDGDIPAGTEEIVVDRLEKSNILWLRKGQKKG